MFQQISPSTKLYLLLILLLAILSALNAFLPQGELAATIPENQLPASKTTIALVTAGTMLVIYGGLGFIGLKLAEKLDFPKLWDNAVTNRQKFLVPVVVGIAIGIFFILADAIFQRWHSLGALPHPPFPTSLVASAVAGIGEEVIFRLFLIPFWLWLISSVILRGRWQNGIFWVVTIFSALAFAAGHIPSAMFALGYETVVQIPSAILVEIFLLNGVISIAAAYYFRKYGFLAAVGIHFWTDIVWHVIWGLVG